MKKQLKIHYNDPAQYISKPRCGQKNWRMLTKDKDAITCIKCAIMIHNRW